ncbi:multiple organellar RNA editing factor 8, chloroplastic/mitochondrial isoform X2 [Daucus carota subsp. sativus]|uniref:multiple organellar RNA editing factor 8, chloroplastic/mitochondrial isoform X2 n=1 Tax=Daucus carota subsp. sativus TaxID=79200 RepID=UPI003082CA9C
MATRSISRVLSRSLSSLRVKSPSCHHSTISRPRPLAAVVDTFRQISPAATIARGFATRQTTSSLNDSSPNWSNRPPKETILLDGCDFEHWLVVVEKPEGDPTRDEIIDGYIKTLASIVGSEDEARMKIYSVSTRHYYAFGALVSEELSYKLKELPHVRWVLPDSYLDVKNKDYGGEPFINGQAVPYDPKYHEEWVRNNARANERNRRNDRPRNNDRSRNFERRGNNMQQQRGGMGGGPPGTMGGGPPGNMGGGPPGNMGGGPPGNMGGGPPGNMGGGPPGNMGGGPPGNVRGGPPGGMGGGPYGNMGGGPPGNLGQMQNNMGQMQHGNMGPMGGPSQNMGGAQHRQTESFEQRNMPSNGGYPSGPGPDRGYQNSYPPNTAGGNYQ